MKTQVFYLKPKSWEFKAERKIEKVIILKVKAKSKSFIFQLPVPTRHKKISHVNDYKKFMKSKNCHFNDKTVIKIDKKQDWNLRHV